MLVSLAEGYRSRCHPAFQLQKQVCHMQCLGVGTTRDTALPSETSEGPRALSAQSSELTAQVLCLRVKGGFSLKDDRWSI